MKWTDTQDIAMALTDKHQDIDPQQVRFTDLHRWVTELEGFDDGGCTHAGVVDEDIQAAEGCHRLIDRIGHLLRVGAVGLDRHRRTTLRRHLRTQVLCRAWRCGVGECHHCAVGGQPSHDRRTDPPRTARHQGSPTR